MLMENISDVKKDYNFLCLLWACLAGLGNLQDNRKQKMILLMPIISLAWTGDSDVSSSVLV